VERFEMKRSMSIRFRIACFGPFDCRRSMNNPDYTCAYEMIDNNALTIIYDQKKTKVTTPLKHYLK